MEVVIRVSRDDIRKGKIESSEYCPIARAVKRMVIKGTKVSVCQDVIDLKNEALDSDENLSNPEESFVRRFDNGEKVSPMEFTLDIPCEVLKPGLFKQVKF
jgi:hypothetical protein